MNRYETSINNKRMFIIYSVGGQAGVFIDWLRNGCIESPQEVAQVQLIQLNYNDKKLKFIEKSLNFINEF